MADLPCSPPPPAPSDLLPALASELSDDRGNLFRFSVAQYHQMIATGILSAAGGASLAKQYRLELLDGWLVLKLPKNPPHTLATALTREALAAILPPEWHLRCQEPLTLATSEPEPDLAIVRGQPRDYGGGVSLAKQYRHPAAQDVGLVVEVADATLSRARAWKQPLYAEAGIPQLWIVNLPDRQLEQYAQPQPGEAARQLPARYAQQQVGSGGDLLEVSLDGQIIGQVAVADLLP